MRHDHSSTAVSLAAKCVHCVAVESLVSGTSSSGIVLPQFTDPSGTPWSSCRRYRSHRSPTTWIAFALAGRVLRPWYVHTHLATREAAYWDDHSECEEFVRITRQILSFCRVTLRLPKNWFRVGRRGKDSVTGEIRSHVKCSAEVNRASLKMAA